MSNGTSTLVRNLEAADRLLAEAKTQGIAHLIGGERTEATSGALFENLSPVDGSVMCQVARGTPGDIDKAASAARAAFADWRATPPAQRRDILHAIADAIDARAGDIALMESADTGQPLRFMEKGVARGADNFRFFGDRAPDAANGLALPSDEHMNYTTRQPIGPVGIITPWNTPFMLSTWKLAPALAAGCTVVHKPAEWSPITASLLAQLMLDAGLPPGVLNVVHGLGEEAGVALTEHPFIKAVAFVGESSTGSAIMAQGAPSLKRVHFELGGKNPVIVFADADLDRAVDAAIFMIYSLNGERCTSSSRVLVERSIHDAFVERLAERARQIKVGHPLDPDTWLGPLIHKRHFDKVVSYFGIAKDDGATIVAGGTVPEDAPSSGHYVNATLFANATTDMRIAQEEIFGPVLTAIPFDDEADALKIANDVRYGLTAYIWTRDMARALRMSHGVDAGMVWVNSQNVRHLPAPFGGMKASGIGRDGGDYSFDFYMETKNICLAMGDHRIPKLGL
jgi:5-carboxymethyl-2-hydroxymuconic-semialdehyde dehydrogenase